jgi:abortive infection bacteriophage resistance protein
MTIELMSFGEWSKLYSNLKHKNNRRLIATRFKKPEHYLKNWISSLVALRNACAHHQRIWNKQLTYTPLLSSKDYSMISNADRVASRILILAKLLDPLDLKISFIREMEELFFSYPYVPKSAMGFRVRDSAENMAFVE